MGPFLYILVIALQSLMTSINADTTGVRTGSCEKGWMFHGDMCYLVRDDYETFDTAFADCKLFGAELAYATDANSLKYLNHFVSKSNTFGWWLGTKIMRIFSGISIYDPIARRYNNIEDSNIRVPNQKEIEMPSTSCVGLEHTKGLSNPKDVFVDVNCKVKLPYVCSGDFKNIQLSLLIGSQVVRDGPDVFYFSARSDRRSYEDAQKACRDKSLTLMSIRGDPQMKKILKQLADRQDGHVDPWWTGLQVKGGVFLWSNGHYMETALIKFNEKAKKDNVFEKFDCRIFLHGNLMDSRSCDLSKAPYLCMRPHRLTGEFGCAPGWTRAGKSCYSVLRPFSTITLSHETAERACSKASGHLVSVNSNVEKLWLRKSNFVYFSNPIWTSLKKVGDGYQWSDGSSATRKVLTWSSGDYLDGNGKCFYMAPLSGSLFRSECHGLAMPGCQYKSEGPCVSSKWIKYKGNCYFNISGLDYRALRQRSTMLFPCYEDTTKYNDTLVLSTLKVDEPGVLDLYRRMNPSGRTHVWTGMNEYSKGVYTWDDGTVVDMALTVLKTMNKYNTSSSSSCYILDRHGDFQPTLCSMNKDCKASNSNKCFRAQTVCEQEIAKYKYNTGRTVTSDFFAAMMSFALSIIASHRLL